MPEPVTFQEEQQYQTGAEQKPFLIRLVLKTGLVSTEKQAQYVLLALALGLVIVAIVLPMIVAPSQPKVPQSVIDAAMQVPLSN